MTNPNAQLSAARMNGEKPARELTKREHFAAVALQGLLASGHIEPGEINHAISPARYAADRLLIELESAK